MFNAELPVTQFGYTEVLTDGLFDKKVNTRVIFNPDTGGILKIEKINLKVLTRINKKKRLCFFRQGLSFMKIPFLYKIKS